VTRPSLRMLVGRLRQHDALSAKRDIQRISACLPHTAAPAWPGLGPQSRLIKNGDDAAAIPDGDGFLLVAAEGMLPRFVQAEPWFSGFCSVMVNISDICAMGGRPLAVVDVLFSGNQTDNGRVLAGMRDASEAFGVPVVGGHTSRLAGPTALAVAIVGRARRLITSFDARPGQKLVFAVDQRGAYRGPGDNFNAATCATSSELRSRYSLLADLSEGGLVNAGKDVSMAGVLGTLAMLCESSGVGASVELDAIEPPLGISLERWLTTFPSFGFILAIDDDKLPESLARFGGVGVSAKVIGSVDDSERIQLSLGRETALYLDLAKEAVTGFDSLATRRARHNAALGVC